MSVEISDNAREAINDALREHGPHPEGVITGWVMAVEYVAPNGNIGIAKLNGPGEDGVPSWKAAGMFKWGERLEWEGLAEANEEPGEYGDDPGEP